MRMPPLIPARASVQGALAVVTPVVIACALAGWLAGPVAVVGIALGVVSGLVSAVASVGWGLRAVVAALVAGSGAAGLLSAGSPVLAAICVGAAALVQAPLNLRCAGIGVFLPALVAIAASVGLRVDVAVFALWLAAGVALIIGIAHLLGVQGPVVGVARSMALRHAAVTALATGAAMYLTNRLEVGHGYWLVMTLALVLRPVRAETGTQARDRTLGTIAGVVLGTAIVLFVPLWLSLVLVVAFLVVTVAWGITGDTLRSTLFSTPLVVILGSSGLASRSVEVALDRLILTVLGATVAIGLAYVLHRFDSTPGATPDVAG
jgi:Fusaric acid resistance protein-like